MSGSKTKIYGNTAAKGGAAYVSDKHSTTCYEKDATKYATKAEGETNPVGYSEYFSKVTPGNLVMTGGAVYENSANDGGAFYISGGDCTLSGGKIYNNTATGNGGGIYHTNSGKTRGTCTVEGAGEMTGNTAKNGGALYIANGSKLEVDGGLISGNSAKGTPASATTAYTDSANAGVGGGIYLASGTAAEVSDFTMMTGDVGIYNNTADFAADDVYANAKNTNLILPSVSGMGLKGGMGNATGWYEDYATKDSKYTSGTKVGSFSNGADTIKRYRSARSTYEVKPNTGSGDDATIQYGQSAEVYICLKVGVKITGYGTITIDKVVDELPESQVFLFRVQSKKTTSESIDDNAIDFEVAVELTDELTGFVHIADVPDGEYMITEITNWSWRYDHAGENLAADAKDGDVTRTVYVNDTTPNGVATFANKLTHTEWFDGNSPAIVNTGKKKEVA